MTRYLYQFKTAQIVDRQLRAGRDVALGIDGEFPPQEDQSAIGRAGMIDIFGAVPPDATVNASPVLQIANTMPQPTAAAAHGFLPRNDLSFILSDFGTEGEQQRRKTALSLNW